MSFLRIIQVEATQQDGKESNAYNCEPAVGLPPARNWRSLEIERDLRRQRARGYVVRAAEGGKESCTARTCW